LYFARRPAWGVVASVHDRVVQAASQRWNNARDGSDFVVGWLLCPGPAARTRSAGKREEGGLMAELVRMPLDGGGAILLENTGADARAADRDEPTGPVKAGRVGDSVRELPRTVRESLAPVRETARAVLDELREAGPQTVEVEFGVNLSAKAGVVITGGETAVHLKVRLVWGGEADDRPE
jgi:hypothetical protein